MNIDSFKDAVGGGVRNALFRVNGSIGNQGPNNLTTFLCTAAQLPTSTLGQTTAPYRGRNIKIPTSRTFEDWTITILADRGHVLRSQFEQWLDSLNGTRDNIEQVQGAVTDLQTAFFTDWFVDQLDRSGKAIKSYQFKYCFPTSVSSIDLSAESEELESFSVSLTYSYFLTSGVSTGGNVGGDSPNPPGVKTPVTE